MSKSFDASLVGLGKAGAMMFETDGDGSVNLIRTHAQTAQGDEVFRLHPSEIASVLEFFDTPHGKRVAELARGAVAPAAESPTDEAAAIAAEWRALPPATQARVGASLREHVRQALATDDLAHFASRPEVAALLGEQPAQHVAVTSMDLAVFIDQIQARRATKDGVDDAIGQADSMMYACEVAGIDILDDPRWRAGKFFRQTIDDNINFIGWLMCLQALADRPDVCAAVVRRVVSNLEKGLLTDQKFEFGEV